MNPALLNAPHLLETALLLLAAFLIGATIGTLARLAMRRGRAAAAVPGVSAASVPAAAMPAPDLVIAPQLDPLPVAAPAEPAPSLDAAMSALVADITASVSELGVAEPAGEASPTSEERKPARVAGRSVSGRAVAEPERAAATRSQTPEAAVTAFTEALADAHTAEPPEPTAATASEALTAEMEIAPALEPETTDAIAAATEAMAQTMAAADLAQPPEAIEPAAASGAPPIVAESEPAPSPRRKKPDEGDESVAMRAIEGSWTPRRRPARPVEAAEPKAADAAVAASGEAVAAALRAAEAAIGVAVAPPVARPAGLGAPRGGVKDDLTRIVGLLPILETALNGLGLYHFDQVAELSDLNATWLEDYLGISGRITRERWREQARRLADDGATRQAAQ